MVIPAHFFVRSLLRVILITRLLSHGECMYDYESFPFILAIMIWLCT